ncbi:Fic family protein [Limisalsivibrio acetivorans]|uniref:Fic family protein n=1 Tax=Limisalsivibrio acetivorans TaxID=1304888 RepID=UPI0003B6E155|nr:Fic family protein [Limisalsivibrio acetivorans]
MMIKKILTKDYENVSLSCRYDPVAIKPLLAELDARYETVNGLPVVPGAYGFMEEVLNRCVYSNIAIEEENLGEEEALSLLKILQESYHKPVREKTLGNMRIVYNLIDSIIPSSEPFEISEEFIKRLHTHITFDVRREGNIPGCYRTKPADFKHFEPPKSNIPELMRGLTSWFNSPEIKELHPVLRAAAAHYHISMIHPFGDGNGRTARGVEGAILKKAGYRYLCRLMPIYYLENRKEYFHSFIMAERSGGFDMTPFLSFVLEGANRSLRMMYDFLLAGLRKLALNDYWEYLKSEGKIDSEEYSFITGLLSSVCTTGRADDFCLITLSESRRKTAEKLSGKGLLKIDENGHVCLNTELPKP